MESTQTTLIDTPKPHEFEHYYDYLRTRIRVAIEPIPGEHDLYKVVEYRRKRDSDTKWSPPVKEELGRTGTLQELTPGRAPATHEHGGTSDATPETE